MASIDILLVNPVFLSRNQAERDLMSPYFPLGLLYLAAFLRERGISVEIFDGTFKEGLQDFELALTELQPKAVGISVVQPNRAIALEMADIADKHGLFVILGGPDPTAAPAEYLACPSIDVVIHHEGELTLTDLIVEHLNSNSITDSFASMEGIAYRDTAGNVTINPRRAYVLNLDKLPPPARDMVDLDQYLRIWRQENGYASLTISVSRGCPFNCGWCQDSVHGPDFHLRSPQSVVEEVSQIMQAYDIDRLRLVDDVDGIDLQWLEAWAECAQEQGVVMPFEALNDLQRKDIPMLDVRDTL